jgi:hypothetical protein
MPEVWEAFRKAYIALEAAPDDDHCRIAFLKARLTYRRFIRKGGR